MLNQILPNLLINHLVSVQPISGPIGQVKTLKIQYAEPLVEKPEVNPNIPTLEAKVGRKLTVRILNETVEAKSEIIPYTFIDDITSHIDQKVISAIKALDLDGFTYDQSQISEATYCMDAHACLGVLMNCASNSIAQRTRRSAANWALVSPLALAVLVTSRTGSFSSFTTLEDTQRKHPMHVGTLNSTINIFIDRDADENQPIILGFNNSKPDLADAGLIYAPYQITVEDEQTTIQDAILPMRKNEFAICDAKDYFQKIELKNIAFL